MGKKMFARLKEANQASAKLSRRDLNSDYKVTQGGLDAITSNLMTTQGSLGSSLTGANARALAAMSRVSNRSASKLDAVVGRAARQVASKYGSAVAGTPNLLGDARAVQRTAPKVQQGLVRQGTQTAGAGNEALDILSAAGQTAADSGQYELAQALRGRSNDVQETIANNRAALQQEQLQFTQQRALARFQAKLDEKAATRPGGAVYTAAASQLMTLAQQPGATLASVQAQASALAGASNLSPAATTQLKEYATSLFNADGTPTLAAPAAGSTLQSSDKAVVQQSVEKYFMDHQDEFLDEDPSKAPTFVDFVKTLPAYTDPATQADAQNYAYELWQQYRSVWASGTAPAGSNVEAAAQGRFGGPSPLQ